MAKRKATATKGDAPVSGRWQRLFALAATMLVVWWFWNTVLVWPLAILVVMFHELSHAIAAVLTGGHVVSISLSPNEGGLTATTGGWPIVILNAGYLGSLLWGVALMWLSRSPKRALAATYVLAALLFGATFAYVRPILGFGFPFAMLAAFGLAALARKAPTFTSSFLSGLGVFSVLYALVDVHDDVLVAGAGSVSDATMLATATGIPAIVWGVAWIAAGIGVLIVCRKWWMG